MTDPARERRLRRIAAERNLTLRKLHTTDPTDPAFGMWVVIARDGSRYEMRDIDQLERWLTRLR